MRRAAKRDANEAGIVKGMRAHGCWVGLVSGAGLPDLLWAFSCYEGVMEVKEPTGYMTEAQVRVHQAREAAGCTIPIVENLEEAMAIVRETMRGGHPGRGFRTYRDVPWEGHTAEQKARRLAAK